MKIMHVINALEIAGAERLLTDFLPMMKQAGHEITLVLLFGCGSEFENRLRQAGIHLYIIGLPGGRMNPLNVLSLRKWMKGQDVVHTHLFPSQYWAAFAHALSGTKAVLVTTEHNTYNTRGGYAATSWLDRKVYSLYDGIICISPATADFMRSRVPDKVVLKVIENGVALPSTESLQQKKSRKELGLPLADDDFMLLQVARFQEQKDQDCVIRALRLLPARVHAVFAGVGERMSVCEHLAKELNVADRVHFLGLRSDISELWKVADIGVMSSHWEGFGLAAVEAMAHECPVLASDVKGLAEVVKQPDLLFPPGDEKALADRVMYLLNNEESRRETGLQCRLDAQRYGIDKMTEGYLNFYEELRMKCR